MSNKQLYNETFSKLHASADTEAELMARMRRVRSPRISRKLIVCIAATMALMLVFSMTAFATNLFGLRDLVAADKGLVEYGSGESVPTTIISLQGYTDSNEFKAFSEWNTFLDSYDQDGALLAQVGNSFTKFDELYPTYLVYTQEMVDKLEEIVAKYGLIKHNTTTCFSTADEFYAAAQVGEFILPPTDSAKNTFGAAYVHEELSFGASGTVETGSGALIDYQMVNSRKGTFNDVSLNIGNLEDYITWEVAAPSGRTVSLALSAHKGLIIADLDNSFVVVNVLAGTANDYLELGQQITAADLEAIAASFDFSRI